ncbi:voltage-gated shaker-like K+ channel, subunit [Polychaeton citri CBS 116435]|uniref:Voltage-gated shaker-like K+ channel, subunit n=1 Tax=Polychaeton citri CBS 116435 TaxID=1314669 RepID=A0A9P4UQ51_9PEZI|nr:voltage-gated shaker-like K+ channel, subunit [Polychaeton citri CBS 116435]
MRAALKTGSEFYGPPEHNSLVLLERYLKKYAEDVDKIVLSIKGGLSPVTHGIDAFPENIRRSLDDSIAQLNGRSKMALFEFGCRDTNFPQKVSFEVVEKEYVQTGKIDGISLSEVRAETIHEAVKLTKVLAVESELSLFSTDILSNGVAAACAQSADLKTSADSMMRHFPRFQPGNFKFNMQLVEQVEKMVSKKGCTSAQLAINWTRAISNRPGMPTIIPIPGATTVERVEENSKLVDITDEEMAEIDATLAKFTTAGERYPDSIPVNT